MRFSFDVSFGFSCYIYIDRFYNYIKRSEYKSYHEEFGFKKLEVGPRVGKSKTPAGWKPEKAPYNLLQTPSIKEYFQYLEDIKFING